MNTLSDISLHTHSTEKREGSRDFEEFIYLLSHDVRNSARALVELPEWIREDMAAEGQPISKSLAENLSLMDVHTRRLDRMLIDLLVYSRVGRKQSVQEVDLLDAVQQVLEQVQLPMGFEVSCDLKCKTLLFGERDILTLLTALISNSIKHHHKDSGSINVSSRVENSECVICVSDDGPGIDEKYQERVFQAMTTLKPRDEVEGSGMGLAIVRKIVELHGGKLAWTKPASQSGTALEMRFQI